MATSFVFSPYQFFITRKGEPVFQGKGNTAGTLQSGRIGRKTG
jgi:hypothetical protein